MSFLMDFTPLTFLVISIALFIAVSEVTKPLSWTTPLNVSTFISRDFRVGSLNIAAFTLLVMTLSSMYSPVLSCVEVEAQPYENSSAIVIIKTEKNLSRFIFISLIIFIYYLICFDVLVCINH